MANSWVVVAENSNHETLVFGPFKNEEAARKAAFKKGEENQLHQYRAYQVLDPDDAVAVVYKPMYEQDLEKVLLHDMAVEAQEDFEDPAQVDMAAAAQGNKEES